MGKRMTLKEIIEFAAHSADVQQNLLTDGKLNCLYEEMPGYFEQIDQYMTSQGILPGDGIAYECTNTVPGALTLLYLLTHHRHFVLLPPSDGHRQTDKNRLDLKPVPHFCQYRVAINNTIQDVQPEDFLQIGQNPQYNGLQVAEAHAQPKGAVYLRTSGSMGVSKITVHAHAKLLDNALNCVKRFGLESSDRVAIPVPIFHMYGLGAGFLPAIAARASIDLQQKSNLLRYLGRERKFNPNVAYLTPTLCDLFVQGRKTKRPYKRVVTATQRIKEDTFYKFDAQFGGLLNLYGSTELGAIATSMPNDPVTLRATTIKPMPNVQLHVERSGRGQEAAGILRCQHPAGFTGYVDEEGAWIQRLAADGWYETGDVAQALANGSFRIVGRAKNSVNRRGYLVLFADIERAMEKISNIEQVVVVAAKGESRQGQRIAAFCMPEAGAPNDETGSQIRQRCLDLLPNYAVPDDVFVMQTFPALPNGKVDRQALMARVS